MAILDRRVVGFIYLKRRVFSKDPQFKKVEYVLIEDCVVLEEYRRRGIATALVQAAQRWAGEHGLGRMQLEVWANNEPARQMYRKLGFQKLILRMELDEQSGTVDTRSNLACG